MTLKTSSVIIVIALLIGAGLIVKGKLQENTQTTTEVESNTTWKYFSNTAYAYSISYPDKADIVPTSEEDTRPVNQQGDIYIFVPGKITIVGIANLGTTTSTLKETSQTIQNIQINDKNPYVKGKQVGELKNITFAGKNAYSFTLTKSFTTSNNGGYTLPDNSTFNYVFVENKGKRFMIRYPLNDSLSEEMVKSFTFVQ